MPAIGAYRQQPCRSCVPAKLQSVSVSWPSVAHRVARYLTHCALSDPLPAQLESSKVARLALPVTGQLRLQSRLSYTHSAHAVQSTGETDPGSKTIPGQSQPCRRHSQGFVARPRPTESACRPNMPTQPASQRNLEMENRTERDSARSTVRRSETESVTPCTSVRLPRFLAADLVNSQRLKLNVGKKR